MDIIYGITIAVLLVAVGYLIRDRKQKRIKVAKLKDELEAREVISNMHLAKYQKVLSQKKSSETRLGQISENLIPFLDGCSYNPKDMHFMGNPIDYLVFDFDEGKIVFLEVKSGNSRASKRQKTIKSLVQNGMVYYEELRINEKGIKGKKAKNEK